MHLLDIFLPLMHKQQLRRHLDLSPLRVNNGTGRRGLVLVRFDGEVPEGDAVVRGGGEEEGCVVGGPGDGGDGGAVPGEVGDGLGG